MVACSIAVGMDITLEPFRRASGIRALLNIEVQQGQDTTQLNACKDTIVRFLYKLGSPQISQMISILIYKHSNNGRVHGA